MLVNSGVDTELISARNLVWALHSESQEAMLRAASDSCGGRMLWPDAKRLGVFQWLKAPQLVSPQLPELTPGCTNGPRRS